MRCLLGWAAAAVVMAAMPGRVRADGAERTEGTGEIAERLTREAIEREAHDEAERTALDAAELAYQRHVIRFCVGRGICEGDQEIGGERFYRMVGREDLADRYHQRRSWVVAGLATSGAALVVGAAMMALDHGRSDAMTVGIGLLGGGIVVGTATVVVSRVGEPGDDERSMADAYNRQLRQRLGLPGHARAPAVSGLQVAPYAAERGGGFVFGGRF